VIAVVKTQMRSVVPSTFWIGAEVNSIA